MKIEIIKAINARVQFSERKVYLIIYNKDAGSSIKYIIINYLK